MVHLKSAHFLKTDVTTSQDLSAAALDYTTSYGRAFKLEQVIFHFDTAVTETVTITLDSKNGANYDTILQEVDLVAETDFVYRPQGECNCQAGDEIKIECTDGNGTGIGYAIIKTSEM